MSSSFITTITNAPIGSSISVTRTTTTWIYTITDKTDFGSYWSIDVIISGVGNTSLSPSNGDRYIICFFLGAPGSSGTSGTSGANGTSGTSGSSGTSGTSGANGTSGTSGANGTSGTSGTRGTSGSSGANGTSGTSGTRGTSGSSGANGTSGTSGTRGTSGSSGANGTSGANGIDGVAGASGTAGTSGTSSTNATSVSITNGNSTPTYFYPVFVSDSGSTQTLYVDKESVQINSLSYYPFSNSLYVGYQNNGTVATDNLYGTNTIELNALGTGMFNDTTSMAFGDYNGNSVTTVLWGNSSVNIGELTSTGVKFNESTTYKKPNAATAYGEIVTYGSGSSLTAGFIYYLASSGTWTVANSNLPSSSKFLLAIALGTNASSGMLVRGYARFTSVGNYASVTLGQILYVGTTNGFFQNTAPTSTGQVVRVIGYCVDATNDTIYFCPDNTWIELP